MNNQDEKDSKLQIIYDHYKDSFSRIRDHETKRDRFLWLSLGILALTYFQAFSPDGSDNLFSQLLKNKLNITVSSDITSFIGSIIWFSLFITVMQYFQTVSHIGKLYNHHTKTEEKINTYYNESIFTRESDAYNIEKTMFTTWTKHIYKTIYPAILMIIVLWKVKIELFSGKSPLLAIIFNSFIVTCLVISIVLYLIKIHLKK